MWLAVVVPWKQMTNWNQMKNWRKIAVFRASHVTEKGRKMLSVTLCMILILKVILYFIIDRLTLLMYRIHFSLSTLRFSFSTSVDPDQMVSNSPSDQGPHCSLLISILGTSKDKTCNQFNLSRFYRLIYLGLK